VNDLTIHVEIHKRHSPEDLKSIRTLIDSGCPITIMFPRRMTPALWQLADYATDAKRKENR
jgi:hypothetical protein